MAIFLEKLAQQGHKIAAAFVDYGNEQDCTLEQLKSAKESEWEQAAVDRETK